MYIQGGVIEKTNEIPGKIFFVDGTNGSDTTGDGKTWSSAYETIATAITACTTLQGDKIYVRGGQTYTLTAGLSLSKSSVEIIAVGGKATINTSATATELLTITVPSNSVNLYGVKIKNFIFTASGTTATVGLVKLTSNTTFVYDTLFEDCIFDTTATTVDLQSLVSDDGVRTTFNNCKFGSPTIPAQIVQLYLGGANTISGAVFNNCVMNHHMSATADCYITGGAAMTSMFVNNCLFANTNATNFASAVGIVIAAGIAYVKNSAVDGTTLGTTAKVRVSPIAQNAAGNALKWSGAFGDGASAVLPA
jgi:hypothetical protein